MIKQYKINEDGTLSVGTVKFIIDGYSDDWTKIEVKEDNSFYDFYNEDGTVNAQLQMEFDTNNTLQAMETAIQEHIDSVAKSLGYDDISSIGKYLGYANPFRDECEQLGLYNSDCWIRAFQIQQEVEQGLRPMPTMEELIAELPVYVA